MKPMAKNSQRWTKVIVLRPVTLSCGGSKVNHFAAVRRTTSQPMRQTLVTVRQVNDGNFVSLARNLAPAIHSPFGG